jgi:hypothetical protein
VPHKIPSTLRINGSRWQELTGEREKGRRGRLKRHYRTRQRRPAAGDRATAEIENTNGWY